MVFCYSNLNRLRQKIGIKKWGCCCNKCGSGFRTRQWAEARRILRYSHSLISAGDWFQTRVHMSIPPRILLTGIPLGWVMHVPPRRTLGQDDWPETTQKLTHYHKTRDCKPHGRAVLGSLTLLLSAWTLLPNKVSCFVGMCVSSYNSFLSARQEPTLGPWKGSLFLQQKYG